MNKKEISYRVSYSNQQMVELNNIVSNFDLGIEGLIKEEIFSWKTSSKINSKYIKKMENGLRESLEKFGCKVYNIKCLIDE